MTLVKYGVTYTINLGDYNSAKIMVGVEDNPRGDETAMGAYSRIKKFCDDRLKESLDELEQ